MPKNGSEQSIAPVAALGIRLKSNWSVAQLVEHLTVNQAVAGSNPAAPAKFV